MIKSDFGKIEITGLKPVIMVEFLEKFWGKIFTTVFYRMRMSQNNLRVIRKHQKIMKRNG